MVIAMVGTHAQDVHVVDWSDSGSMSQPEFQDSMIKDPVGAFDADPARAWNTIEADPGLMKEPGILDVAFLKDPLAASNMINKKPDLLDDSNVAARFDKEARKTLLVLNDNPEAKKRWFAQRGITDEGAEVESYDGTLISTRGPEATTFDIKANPGARVLSTGKLILENGAEFILGRVSVAKDGSILFTGESDSSNVDLSNTKDADVQVEKGTVILRDRKYQSCTGVAIDIQRKDGQDTISGISVVEMDILSGEITSEFSGTISIYADGHRKIYSGTEYAVYQDGKESRVYTTSKDVLYYSKQERCSPGTNCIEDYLDPNDPLALLYDKLKSESQKEGFSLDNFIRVQEEDFKVAHYVPDPESRYFNLFLEMSNLQQLTQDSNFDLKAYMVQSADYIKNSHPDVAGMLADPLYGFYSDLSRYVSSEGTAGVKDYINLQLRDFMINDYEKRPENEENRVYRMLEDMKTAKASWKDGYNVQDYLADIGNPPTVNRVKISAVDDPNVEGDNIISLRLIDGSVDGLAMDQIKDKSQVDLNVKDARKISFTEDSIKLEGDPDVMTNLDITASYINEIGEQHDFSLENGVVTHCSMPCKICGNYYSAAERVIQNFKEIDWDQMKELKSYLTSKWGSYPRSYLNCFNEESEKDFISMCYRVSETASQNKNGIKVTPQEVAVTFMAEGGINIFSLKKEKMPIPADQKEIEYNNNIYEVKINSDGEAYIELPTTYSQYWLPIPDNVKELNINGITYSIKSDNGGQYFEEKYNKIMDVDAPAGSNYEYNGKSYVVAKGAKFTYITIEAVEKHYEMPIDPEAKDVEYNGKIYPVYNTNDGDPFVLLPGKDRLYEIPIPDGSNKVTIQGKVFKVFTNEYGGKYYYSDGMYYDDHNLPVNGIADLGTDVIGMKNRDGEVEFDRLKRLGYIPEYVQMTPQGSQITDDYKVKSGSFNTLLDGFSTLAGVYAERKYETKTTWDKLYNEGSLKVKWDDLPVEEQFYWTTIFYNTPTRLRESSIIEQNGKVKNALDTCGNYCRDYWINAQRRAAQLEYMNAANLFR